MNYAQLIESMRFFEGIPEMEIRAMAPKPARVAFAKVVRLR
jgi:hypothetical protein